MWTVQWNQLQQEILNVSIICKSFKVFCRTSAMVVWMSILDPDPIILLVTTWLFMWRYGQDEFFPFTFACVTDPNITTHVWLLLQSWVWFNFLAASGCISFSTLCSLPRRSLNTPPSHKLKRKGFFATMQWCCVNLALQLYQRGSNWQKRIRLKFTPRCYSIDVHKDE